MNTKRCSRLKWILIMLIALVSTVAVGEGRMIYCHSQARHHRKEAEKVTDLFLYLTFQPAPMGFPQAPSPDVAAREIPLWHAFRAYHEQMQAKYEYAASRPWIWVTGAGSPPDEPITLKAALKDKTH